MGELGSLRSPTLRFPVALKVWLGHLTETGDMRDALTRQQRYVEDMLDTIDISTRGRGAMPGGATRGW